MKKIVLLTFLVTSLGWIAGACSSDSEFTEPVLPEESGEEEVVVTYKVDSTLLICKKDNMKIHGMMYTSTKESGKRPTVILSHSSSLTHKAMAGYAYQLANEGYAAYCFDFCGGSDESQSDGDTKDMTVFTEIEDLRAVVNTIKTLDYVDTSRIYLLGSSQGGLVSALLAEEIADELAGMVLFYPAFNIPELVSKFSGLGNMGGWGDSGNISGMMSMSEAYINSIKDYDVWAHIGTFPKPVCIVHGTQDIIVPIANSEKAVTLYPKATLYKIDGANHGFNEANLGSIGSMMGGTTNYDSKVMPLVISFLNKK